MQINIKGNLFDLSTPAVMGILNTTPDSFYANSRVQHLDHALQKADEMLNQGADFIDIGGMSTRPGSEIPSESEELKRLIPVIESLAKHFPDIVISVDTWRSKVAKEAVQAGASMINDISAGRMDENLFSVVAELNVPYVLMHMLGNPQTMQQNPVYEYVVIEVNRFLADKVVELRKLGVNDIILDPGFGFGKTLEHNYDLLNQLDLIGYGEFPLLVGVSRKSMIKKLLNVDEENALNGTTAVNMIALQKGAKILRVHDVKEAKQTVEIWKMLNRSVY
ncbi:MAG: dihydropteroate synthase [Weeksellaceae bacterium]|nr:dihydropteroate synthase [Weeksellaceae bacterium]